MMMSNDVQIFHNPSCSKSRGALQILEARGVDADVVRYLDTPPDGAMLERILDAIPDEPIALVRTGDDKFRAAELTKADVQTRDQVIDVFVEAPGSDGAARRVRRRPRGDCASVGEGARTPPLITRRSSRRASRGSRRHGRHGVPTR
jgi:arsenate reductase